MTKFVAMLLDIVHQASCIMKSMIIDLLSV